MDSRSESSAVVARDDQEDPQAEWPSGPAFPTAIDRPAGRFEGSVSGITGQPLRYFIPDPLPELLRRCGGFKHRRKAGQNDIPTALLLARAAARRGIAGRVDESQARRFCELIIGARNCSSVDTMKRLGAEIRSRNDGFREEIAYAGGNVASAAKIIFAPHGCIPELFYSLSEGFDGITVDDDPGLVAAITGFFCVRMHPFLDGNGRWSRLIAATAGMRAGSITPAMSSVVFQNCAKQDLVDAVWEEACNSGLREYL